MADTSGVKRKKRLIIHLDNVVRHICRDLNLDPLDRDYVLFRLKNEGVRFLTKILPLYSKYALACVEHQSLIDARTFGLTSFVLKGRAPRFLRGLLDKSIKGCHKSLYAIRQLCEYFYKMAFGFSKAEIRASAERYIESDNAVSNSNLVLDLGRVEKARKLFESTFPVLANSHVQDIFQHTRPFDGPGAFYGSERLSIRFELFKRLPNEYIGSHPDTLNAYSGFFKPYPSHEGGIKPVDTLKRCRIVFVPKDSRGPRVISKEPLHVQKALMAYGKYLSHWLNRESSGKINFADQTVNRELARESSINRKNATVDLKDASDRISLDLVRRIFMNSPALRALTNLIRSTHYELSIDNYNVVSKMHKFANMGSGVCFPVLSLVVYLFAVIGVSDYYGGNPRKYLNMVHVYGDDLIVPTCALRSVKHSLESVGLRINVDKTFYNGYFRESCGGDYYHGESVGPARLKLSGEDLSEVRQYRNLCVPVTNDNGLLQLERHCREILLEKGLFSLAEYYYSKLEGYFGLKFPIVGATSAALGRVSFNKEPVLVPTSTIVPVTRKSRLTRACPYKGISAALRCETGLGADWSLVPLRRSIDLKRRVVEPAQLVPYGLT